MSTSEMLSVKRRYLYPDEVERLYNEAKQGRHSVRDRTMIALAYRHGLRASELVALQWSDINLEDALLHVHRLKNGIASTHPILGRELRDLRALRRAVGGPYLFLSERGGTLTANAFTQIMHKLSERAGLGFKAYPHMLRHACGYALANRGHDTRSIQLYLGHRNIQNTTMYTELSPERFRNFWRD